MTRTPVVPVPVSVSVVVNVIGNTATKLDDDASSVAEPRRSCTLDMTLTRGQLGTTSNTFSAGLIKE